MIFLQRVFVGERRRK